MTRAVISGYYGFHNLGDEAVLFSMLQTLREFDPEFQPVVLSADPRFTGHTYGVESVNRWKPGEVARALRGADMLISGGGSLLQDVTGLKSLAYYLGVIWLARFLGKPVIFYAQGIGPVTSRPGRYMVARAAGGAAALTVRDEESRADLLDMGVKKQVLVTADPVLGLNQGEVPAGPGREILRAAGAGLSGGRLVGISVRPWKEESWQPVLAGVCDELVQKGMQVVFLPMQHPGDLQVSEAVAGMMNAPSIIVRQRCSVPQILSVMGNLDLLVGMRLHSLIMAAVLGVPPVGIAYDPKVERFLARLELKPAGTTGDLTGEALLNAVNNALAIDREELLNRVAPLREKAREGAKLALRAIK